MKILGIIPSRYASTRFPAKPLHLIAGKPLVQHVVERCQLAKSLSEVIVATDDERIAAVARKFCRVEMTRDNHPSGSDRIAEVAARLGCTSPRWPRGSSLKTGQSGARSRSPRVAPADWWQPR